jgi:putative DNA primase/helicase
VKPQLLPLDEFGNASRFVRDHGDRVRRLAETGEWLVWEGRRWTRAGAQPLVEQFARATLQSIGGEAANHPRESEDIFSWHRRSQSLRHREAVLTLAKSDPALLVPVDALDAHPMLLNVENGVIDLRTGAIGPHEPRLLLSQLAPIRYNPGALAPRFVKFLSEIAQDADVQAFLSRWFGYAATGSTEEQALLLLYGAGSNGKTTFLLALQAVLGSDYCGTAAPRLLLSRGGEVHPTELADLAGKRLVTTSEVPQDASFDEERVKALTGSDRVKARRMREDFSEFRPTHKLLLAANHLPEVRDRSEGMWRRLLVLPFPKTFAGGERQRGLLDELLAEREGILAWLVRGAVEWHAVGLRAPPAVLDAVAAYRAKSAPIELFSEFASHVSAGGAPLSKLHEWFGEWAAEHGARWLTDRALASELRTLGWQNQHSRIRNLWFPPGVRAVS